MVRCRRLLRDVVLLGKVCRVTHQEEITSVVQQSVDSGISGPDRDADVHFDDAVRRGGVVQSNGANELKARTRHSPKVTILLGRRAPQVKVILGCERVRRSKMATDIGGRIGVEGIGLRVDCYSHLQTPVYGTLKGYDIKTLTKQNKPKVSKRITPYSVASGAWWASSEPT